MRAGCAQRPSLSTFMRSRLRIPPAHETFDSGSVRS
jgi:hypothetical protein